MERDILATQEASLPEPARGLSRLLHDRFTCRSYRPDPVPRPVIEKIVEVAQFTPSWCNTQPWQLIITEGEETRRFADALYAHATSGVAPSSDFPFPARYSGVYDVRRKECAAQLYGSLGIDRQDRAGSMQQTMENFRLFGAPHAAIVTTSAELGVYGAIDCGLFVSTFLLAAQGFGVATSPQAALAAYGGFIRDYFAIPDDRMIVCGISFGYADKDHAANAFRTTRTSARDVIDFRS